jgi:ELWxxDGT repeat protein
MVALVALAFAHPATAGAAVTVEHLADVEACSDPGGQYFAEVGGRVLFCALGATPPETLWSSDGTAGGTSSMFQFDVSPSNLGEITPIGDEAVFAGPGAQRRSEETLLWRTDGTAAGTKPLKGLAAFSPFSDEIDNSPNFEFTQFRHELYFRGGKLDRTNPASLWRTDGTSHGTRPVGHHQAFGAPRDFVVAGRSLYFGAVASNAGKAWVLWKTDGTGAGTKRIPVVRGARVYRYPGIVGSLGNRVVFSAQTGFRNSLWITDGTRRGTKLLKRNVAASGGGVRLGSSLIFGAYGKVPHKGVEMLSTDGTAHGTIVLRASDPNFYPSDLTRLGSSVLFAASDPANGDGLWRTDGTAAGTGFVTGPAVAPSSLTRLGATVYFSAAGELWQTDGTESGTQSVFDPNPSGTATVRGLSPVGGKLFFTSDTGSDVSGFNTWVATP